MKRSPSIFLALAFILIFYACSESSTEKSLNPPNLPSELVADAVSPSQIDLSWIDNSNNETKFEVWRKTQGGTWGILNELAEDSVIYSDTGLAPGTAYYYQVRACNPDGCSNYSNTASATTQEPPLTPPLAPSNLFAYALSGSQIFLVWKDNSDNEQGFKIERDDGSGFIELTTVSANQTSYLDQGLSSNSFYAYRVRAYNSAGDSDFTNTASALTFLICTDFDGDGYYAEPGCGLYQDCDDYNNTIHPGAPELCDGLDNNCNGAPAVTEIDNDNDGFMVCAGDCNDNNPNVYPGATELCDGIDNDCNGSPMPTEVDNDNDGVMKCAGDCNDNNPNVYPGATELCDGLDNDCSGSPMPTEIDNDGDGIKLCQGDCNDNDSNNWSSCSTCTDSDGDGYRGTACDISQDCNDNDPNNWISCATCQDLDGDLWYDNCDRYFTIYGPDCDDLDLFHWQDCGICEDWDGDGFGYNCDLGDDYCDDDPLNWTEANCYLGDCADYDGDEHRGGEFCDLPDDCDENDPNNWSLCGRCQDKDGDGWYSQCNRYATIYGPDCDDTNPTHWHDCAQCQDLDGDGYGETGFFCDLYKTDDCDEQNPFNHPNAPEVVDGYDNNCDGNIDEVEIIVFSDPELENDIRGCIMKYDGDVTNYDAAGYQECWISCEDNIIGIEYLVSLTTLFLLPYPDIALDLSPLSSLPVLTYLEIIDSRLYDLSPLSYLTSLQELYLWGNQISNLAPLSNLTNLRILDLGDNLIRNISPLSGLTNLQELLLYYNNITDISALAGLTNLTELYLWDNQISDISALANLTNLTALDLGSNQITELQALVDNPGIGSGDYIYLTGNPLGPGTCDQIAELQARGADVYYNYCE